MFQRVRQLQQRNAQLEAQAQAQAARIEELEWRLAVERQTNAALMGECGAVRTATASMRRSVAQSEAATAGLASPLVRRQLQGDVQGEREGTGVEAGEGRPDAGDGWVWKGVCRIFELFDGNKDGILDVAEMNSLQVHARFA